LMSLKPVDVLPLKNREHFDGVMAKVRDVPPLPGDER
jgi:hypothetical protein